MFLFTRAVFTPKIANFSTKHSNHNVPTGFGPSGPDKNCNISFDMNTMNDQNRTLRDAGDRLTYEVILCIVIHKKSYSLWFTGNFRSF